ncbi:MAG: zinc ABC transporter substrate-binding protein [Burkholderiales bacterium]|nr:zinc ABC transporter substrate-binding protein [Burkholderiales bacterium]
MKRLVSLLGSVIMLASSVPALAEVAVFACQSEWAALTREIGGDRVNVFSATTGLQDVHRIQARPSLIARARNAELLVCSGADLEAGWLPLILQQAGNTRIQAGKPGHLEAASVARMLEVPAVVDRSMGDVHPRGNPHLHWDPGNVLTVAEVLADRLARIDAAGARYYESRFAQFEQRWTQAVAQWQQKAAPLRGTGVIEHHRALSYLFAWLGMPVLGSLEPKPGVEPTSAHLVALVERQRSTPAKLIVRTAINNPKAAQWLSQQTGMPVVELPYSVGSTPGAKDLFGMYEDAIARLLGASRP